MRQSEIEIIGRRLSKSKGYYEWCKKHQIDPETGMAVKKDKVD